MWRLLAASQIIIFHSPLRWQNCFTPTALPSSQRPQLTAMLAAMFSHVTKVPSMHLKLKHNDAHGKSLYCLFCPVPWSESIPACAPQVHSEEKQMEESRTSDNHEGTIIVLSFLKQCSCRWEMINYWCSLGVSSYLSLRFLQTYSYT